MPDSPSRSSSSSTEDYIRVIYGLVERGEAVTNTTLAARLEVSPSSASGMVTKLSQQGLVEHVPYRGIELTPAGRLLARGVLRRHRLIETYLVQELGYTWDEVHGEADALEHAVSDRLVERISAKLGHPVRDPHGDPIPAADGSVEELPTRLLDELEPGAVGQIVRVWDTDPNMLRYLADHAIGIGERIEVVERQPFGGSLVVKVGPARDATTHALGKEIAQALSVAVH
ncbi:metal-dependent transcriptional regulator [Amycolatopsis acidiphila]|uniref:Manganese transport regulator n=1 Tax=Amycolatopsis acidiphila TaxID=715473 RepID=A0A558AJX1_9PSEU|nr:metal-dependent transcriptional regulator [Amycolatopsis acidiphila]TVT24549.1 metal-dependent transcriptional regulator [Amycolatopsis acidiphila]UIJ59238.1 metal-dependent transcriptional regulator [Amycolatopsis acidiphila]GHG79292.1 transcriptional regulator [Amycolatopsis acidiphila]